MEINLKDLLLLVFNVIVFPGVIFTGIAGLVASWIDRKITAKVQMRVGPPFLQPFYDIGKLFVKEICIPVNSSKWLFISAPLIGFTGVVLASVMIWKAMLAQESFTADIIVIIYFLLFPSLGTILGAFASRNPLASVGGSREMKLIISYEVPFILSLLIPVMKAGSIRLYEISLVPHGISSISGFIAMLVGLICLQAKLALVPFDAPEAETELAGGAYIEYSGALLGIYKLTRSMMLFTGPVFLIAVFLGGWDVFSFTGIFTGLLKYIILLTLIVLIRNTAPRFTIEHAVKFFWGPVTVIALFANSLALWFGI